MDQTLSAKFRGRNLAAQYANELARYYIRMADELAERRSALVINHGGVVEMGVTASFPNADYESWGEAVYYCEGARLYWEHGKFVNAEVLRIAK